jgi:phosphatidylglycerophosphate synthase
MPQLGIFNVSNNKKESLHMMILTWCISFGIGLFIYQSLDAIDGKQARRTQTSGPLGELFDHGKEI